MQGFALQISVMGEHTKTNPYIYNCPPIIIPPSNPFRFSATSTSARATFPILNPDLLRNSPQSPHHFPIPAHKTKLGVRQSILRRERLYQHARLAQVVFGQPREQVVRHLEVQSAMHELDALVADDVGRRAHLPIREGIAGPEVGPSTC